VNQSSRNRILIGLVAALAALALVVGLAPGLWVSRLRPVAREKVIELLEKRFGIDLSKINFVKDINRGDGYDLCFWVSDGSIPLLRARKNFLHFQVPFKGVNGKSLLNKMKLIRINKIICNSYFTKRHIDSEYGVQSLVIYPPVDVENIAPRTKKNLIIFVGRFSQLEQAKNQHLLVDLFKKFYDGGFRDWRMVLAGGVEVGTDSYFDNLVRRAKSYPIQIIKSPDFKILKNVYGEAKIFWSAVGFGVDEKRFPRKVEHFGISVVESMAGGGVPIVYKSGGYKEIVREGETGFLWSSNREILKKTQSLIKEAKKLKKMSSNARDESKAYRYEMFKARVMEII